MPRLTAASMQDRRDRIIAAAMGCFFKLGFAATSVDDICAEAGISKGAFYTHFASKDAVIKAALATRSGELGPVVEGDDVEAVARSIHARFMAPAMPAAHARFGLELMAASAADETLRAGILADLAAARAALAAAFRRLAETGAVRPDLDAEAAAQAVERYMLGALTRNALDPEPDPEAVVEGLAVLLRGLLA